MYNVIPLSPTWSQRAHARLAHIGDALLKTVAHRIDRLPSWCWPLIAVVAAWPSMSWAFRRLLDGSDDPLGIVALAALMLALWAARLRFRGAPRAAHLTVATAMIVVANLPVAPLPDLMRALLTSLAIAATLAAIAERDEPIAPYTGLAILALPLLSSLQFYAGFPLRVVTAEASRWLLTAAGSEVARVGSALTVDGHLVLVDAPCSGVKMAWVGYFTACIAALLFRVSNRSFFARLPLVGATVLVANIARNTVLVAAEASGVVMTEAMHAAVGLAAFALVCGAIGAMFAQARHRGTPMSIEGAQHDGPRHLATHSMSSRLRIVSASALAIAAMLPMAGSSASAAPVSRHIEWPLSFDGQALIPLALSPVEERFAAQFPGAIARFSAGSRTVVLREVERSTRRLHPAVDCYRGLGFAIDGERLERDAQERMWRCFTATREGRGLRVCERIVDANDHAYTDVSSWYWAASLARSDGPWRAITVAGPASGDRS